MTPYETPRMSGRQKLKFALDSRDNSDEEDTAMVNMKKAPQVSKRVSFMSPKMIRNHLLIEEVSH